MSADHPPLRLLTLYDDVMNVYADRGNTIAVHARARARGLGIHATAASLGDPLPSAADLVLIGGGQDREQWRIADELAGHGDQLRAWADEGVAMLAVCGGFQLFGRWYRDSAGAELPGAGVFDVTTVAPGPGWPRCIGDVIAHSAVDAVGELVGFENHGGRTYLGAGARPFAMVEYGRGNNGEDGTEGAIRDRAIGTYLHGSLLPKNPALLDYLLAGALSHRTESEVRLEPLPAGYAERAHAAAAAVARSRAPRFERPTRPAV
ncbi:MAG: glutamine amidotransferase [Chloroflexi bacterium]|nr:glutamine amidotransferase [Chloroflexota bacterium]MQC27916.1 glutamine amidotransferase [Chloroflexota bacterium]